MAFQVNPSDLDDDLFNTPSDAEHCPPPLMRQAPSHKCLCSFIFDPCAQAPTTSPSAQNLSEVHLSPQAAFQSRGCELLRDIRQHMSLSAKAILVHPCLSVPPQAYPTCQLFKSWTVTHLQCSSKEKTIPFSQVKILPTAFVFST